MPVHSWLMASLNLHASMHRRGRDLSCLQFAMFKTWIEQQAGASRRISVARALILPWQLLLLLRSSHTTSSVSCHGGGADDGVADVGEGSVSLSSTSKYPPWQIPLLLADSRESLAACSPRCS